MSVLSVHCKKCPKMNCSEKSEKNTEFLILQKTPGARRGPQVEAHSPGAATSHDQGLARGYNPPLGLGAPPETPFDYIFAVP